MSTLRVNNITDTSGGSSSLSVPGAAKAWVNFNGTGTVAIRAQMNVSSITDNATGDYTVNFTTAMSDANYCVVALDGELFSTDGSVHVRAAPQASNVRIETGKVPGAGSLDRPYVNVAIFR